MFRQLTGGLKADLHVLANAQLALHVDEHLFGWCVGRCVHRAGHAQRETADDEGVKLAMHSGRHGSKGDEVREGDRCLIVDGLLGDERLVAAIQPKSPSRPLTKMNGGGGIRTLVGGISPETVFETAAFNRSATPPGDTARLDDLFAVLHTSLRFATQLSRRAAR